MRRHSTILSTLVATAVTAGALAAAAPASAEAVVFDTKNVGARAPGHDADTTEWASLDIPTGYARQRLDWHTVGFFEEVGEGRQIILDLHPRTDTVRELRAERDALREEGGKRYHEVAFVVHREEGAPVTARWVYRYAAPGTDDIDDPYSSVMLMGGNRLTVVGSNAARPFVRDLRHHVIHSMTFGG